MINWSTLIKKYRHSPLEYSKRFHCSFEWHLTPHDTLSIENCIRRTPCFKRTHSPSIPRRCPLKHGDCLYKEPWTGRAVSHLTLDSFHCMSKQNHATPRTVRSFLMMACSFCIVVFHPKVTARLLFVVFTLYVLFFGKMAT